MLQLISSPGSVEKYYQEHHHLRLDKFTRLYTYAGFQHRVMESLDKLYPQTPYQIQNMSIHLNIPIVFLRWLSNLFSH